MRRFFHTLALVGFIACNAASSHPGPELPAGSDTSCATFCGDQLESGALTGPLQDCIDECCASSVKRCAQDDGSVPDGGGGLETGSLDSSVPDASPGQDGAAGPDGTSTVDSGMSDAGESDGCTMCGAACCPAGQACVSGACMVPCTTGSQCPSGCCAPATNANGDPIGPYVCKQNDAAPYDCCNGILNDCGNGFCCVADPQGNEFCSAECTSSAMCGAAQCNSYNFSHTTCGGPTACGP